MGYPAPCVKERVWCRRRNGFVRLTVCTVNQSDSRLCVRYAITFPSRVWLRKTRCDRGFYSDTSFSRLLAAFNIAVSNCSKPE